MIAFFAGYFLCSHAHPLPPYHGRRGRLPLLLVRACAYTLHVVYLSLYKSCYFTLFCTLFRKEHKMHGQDRSRPCESPAQLRVHSISDDGRLAFVYFLLLFVVYLACLYVLYLSFFFLLYFPSF